jgi:nucleoside-diphosphate-sugar epimerase
MRVLITGATGLLGSHMAEAFTITRAKVRCLVRPGAKTDFLASLGAELVPGDINQPASLPEAAEGMDIVIHAAGMVTDWGRWDDFRRINVTGTGSVLLASAQAGVRRFIHISSVAVHNGKQPVGGVIPEDDPPRHPPIRDWYSRSKIEAEKLVRSFQDRMGICILRPGWVYGERDRTMLPALEAVLRARQAFMLGSGDNPTTLVYAGDVAQAAVLASTSPRAVGESYHLVPRVPVTQNQLWEEAATLLGCPRVRRRIPVWLALWAAALVEIWGIAAKPKQVPLTRFRVSLLTSNPFRPDKAWNHLAWEASTRFSEGMRKAVEWYLSRRG